MTTDKTEDARGASRLHAGLGADARREIGKWLNEEIQKPIDRVALAELCADYDRLRGLIADEEHKCETCNGEGTIDLRIGGEWNSDPVAACPDCDGRGYWVTPNA